MAITTEQETFWRGDFGNEYANRNKGQDWVATNLAFFSKVLDGTKNINSILEFGSNIGLNLVALSKILPSVSLSAIEINEKAAAEVVNRLPEVDMHHTSILEFEPNSEWDLVFTKGVLIHINPDKLPLVYDLMYKSSSRYILVAEYYNPEPVEIPYRGHSGKLFKRDFAGEMLAKYPDLSLLDYGFVYRLDANFPQDDLTWFLMEKT